MHSPVHTSDTAPEASQAILIHVRKACGFVPNVLGALAESPAALSAYVHIGEQLRAVGALSARERQIVMLTVSAANQCAYGIAAHSVAAERAKVSPASIETLREGRTPADKREAALVRFTRALIEHNGRISDEDQRAFLTAGFVPRQALDILAILAMQTLGDYASHLIDPPLDEAFAARRWHPG